MRAEGGGMRALKDTLHLMRDEGKAVKRALVIE
jgi:hypothetical protein